MTDDFDKAAAEHHIIGLIDQFDIQYEYCGRLIDARCSRHLRKVYTPGSNPKFRMLLPCMS